MADYVPKFKGDTVTYTAGGTIAGGQCVEFSTADTVVATTGASTKYAGVAGFDVVAGEQVTVWHPSLVHRLVASGAIAVGDSVTTAAAGKVVTAATPTATNFVGTATTAAADGGTVTILGR